MFEKFSREQIILGVTVIAVIVIIFVVVKSLMPSPPPPEKTEIKKEPVYEVEIGNVKFSLKEVKDRGNILPASEGKSPYNKKDLTTTERFIQVTIEAQNIGKDDIRAGSWDIGDLVDSQERKFHYNRGFDNWIPEGSECGAILKPGFAPKSCTKIYEVARISSGLKITVSLRQGGSRYIDLGI